MILYLAQKYFRAMALTLNLVPGCHPIAKLYWSISRQIEVFRLFKAWEQQSGEIFQSFQRAIEEMEKNKNESD